MGGGKIAGFGQVRRLALRKPLYPGDERGHAALHPAQAVPKQPDRQQQVDCKNRSAAHQHSLQALECIKIGQTNPRNPVFVKRQNQQPAAVHHPHHDRVIGKIPAGKVRDFGRCVGVQHFGRGAPGPGHHAVGVKQHRPGQVAAIFAGQRGKGGFIHRIVACFPGNTSSERVNRGIGPV